MEYIKFLENEQIQFMNELKEKSNKTWRELSLDNKISKSSLMKYLSGKVLMSKNFFDKNSEEYNIKDYNVDIITINNREKNIKVPKICLELAEFLGALNGDGHVDALTYETCIGAHKILDKDYICNRIPKLFKFLFNLDMKISLEKSEIKCRSYSKRLMRHLNLEYNVPIGAKLNRLQIPEFVLTNKELSLAYLRGLFDTDGTFYGRRNNEPVIGYISLSPNYLEDVRLLLKKNNFNFGKSGKDLYLYNKNEIERFFNEILPQNQKHVTKYRIYKKTGKILKTPELLNYMLSTSGVMVSINS